MAAIAISPFRAKFRKKRFSVRKNAALAFINGIDSNWKGNLAGILGLAEAIRILQSEQAQITAKLTDLRTHFETALLAAIPDLLINGQGPRICNTSNIAFLGLDGEALLMQLDLAGIAVSHGSACSAGALEPSRVLINMGLDRKRARSSLRFSLSRMNTREEIDFTIEQLSHIVKKLREI